MLFLPFLLIASYSKEATDIDISTEEEWASVHRLAEQWSFNTILHRAKVEMKTFKDARGDKLVDLFANDRFPLSRAVKELGQDTAFKLAMIHDRMFGEGTGNVASDVLRALTSELGVDREVAYYEQGIEQRFKEFMQCRLNIPV